MNFWRKIDSREPYKNGENFCTISKWAKNFFSGKILCSAHQKKWFYKLLGSFWKFEFWRKIDSRGPYKNGENFVLSQNVLRKYFFWQNSLFHSSKEVFLQTFRQFLEIEFLTENRQPRTLQKWWKFCTISKCAKKIFFGKILCSTHQKKCFYKLLSSFWKIEFLTEKWQPRTLQKWWKFCTISKCAKKTFFCKILCSTHQKKCFYKLLGSFWKIEFLKENRQPRTLQKW